MGAITGDDDSEKIIKLKLLIKNLNNQAILQNKSLFDDYNNKKKII